MESPGAYVAKLVSRGYFWLALCSFGPPSYSLVVVGIKCKRGITTENQGEGVKYMS